MSKISSLKQYLPVSSRSFHGMYKKLFETSWLIEGIDERLEALDAVLDERLTRIEQRLDGADKQLAAHDEQMKLLAWSLYREEGESFDEAKKRFFRELPAATGSFRLLQLGCAQLLHELDQICQEHGLTYWATWGTLLGAVRHHGFIPWDDDADVAMARNDVLSLMDIVSASERHMVTVVYDPRVLCKQVRFRYRDETIPCFVDIFIQDYVGTEDVAGFERDHAALRSELKERAQMGATADWYALQEDAREGTLEAEPIRELFDWAVARQEEMSDVLGDATGARALVWSVDNIDRGLPGHWRLSPLEDYFPISYLPFEGGRIAVPAAADKILTEMYGDFLSLPTGIHANVNVHYQSGMLDSTETTQVLEALLRG